MYWSMPVALTFPVSIARRQPSTVGTAGEEIARLRPPGVVDGRQHEGVGLDTAGLRGLVVPSLPLDHRVCVDISDVETGRFVVGAPRRQIAHRPVIRSTPRMYGRSTSGTTTLPSGSR